MGTEIILIISRYESKKIENLRPCFWVDYLLLGMTYFNYKITCGTHSQGAIHGIIQRVPFVPKSLLRVRSLSLLSQFVHIKRKTWNKTLKGLFRSYKTRKDWVAAQKPLQE